MEYLVDQKLKVATFATKNNLKLAPITLEIKKKLACHITISAKSIIKISVNRG